MDDSDVESSGQRPEKSRWSGVRDRLIHLVASRVETCGERYVGHLADPLPVVEVEALEGWLGVRLPEDYRTFLVEVAAGGVGPGDGLLTVVRQGGGWVWNDPNTSLVFEPFLVREPFPTLRADGLTRMRMCGPPPYEASFSSLDEYQVAFDAWAERANAGTWAPERRAGAICIQSFNIVQADWLIVSGPARGTIWHEWPDYGRDVDMSPGTDSNGLPLTFARWYLDWLLPAEPSRIVENESNAKVL